MTENGLLESDLFIIQGLCAKLKKTGQAIHDNPDAQLDLNGDELLMALRGLVFGDPGILQVVKDQKIELPPPPTLFQLTVQGGKPTIEFGERDQVDTVRLSVTDTNLSIGVFGAKPKPFRTDEFAIRIGNILDPQTKQAQIGQVGLKGVTITPDPFVNDIPGLGLLAFPIKLATKSNDNPDGVEGVNDLTFKLLEGTHIMRLLYRSIAPIVAWNGPENAETIVRGLQSNIGKNGASFHFLRDIETPTTAFSVAGNELIPALNEVKHKR